MALLAGMYGFFMLFMGFMLVPSNFPDWLHWCYFIGFHTYVFGSSAVCVCLFDVMWCLGLTMFRHWRGIIPFLTQVFVADVHV